MKCHFNSQAYIFKTQCYFWVSCLNVSMKLQTAEIKSCWKKFWSLSPRLAARMPFLINQVLLIHVIYYFKASGRINLQLSVMQKCRSHAKMLQCSGSISTYKRMMLCSHLPISQIPGHMVFLPPLCWHWCLSDSTVSQLTGRKFTK